MAEPVPDQHDATKSTPRYDFYNSQDSTRVILNIYEAGYSPDNVKIDYRKDNISYENGDSALSLNLYGGIKCDESTHRVVKLINGKKSKIELTLTKITAENWPALEKKDDSEELAADSSSSEIKSAESDARPKKHKNWDKISKEELLKEKPKTTNEDPNAGGDIATNDFFKELYSNADDDARRAIMKSYQESNGTVLSMNWSEVGKGKVETKPPSGQEAKHW